MCKDPKGYWKEYEFFGKDLIDLVSKMMAYDPEKRYSIE